MVSQSIWIGIVIGVFFVGIGVSYAIFASTYDPFSKMIIDTAKNGESYVVEMTPRFYSTWDMSGDPTES